MDEQTAQRLLEVERRITEAVCAITQIKMGECAVVMEAVNKLGDWVREHYYVCGTGDLIKR